MSVRRCEDFASFAMALKISPKQQLRQHFKLDLQFC